MISTVQREQLADLATSPETALRIALVTVAQLCICRGLGYSSLFGPEQIPMGVQTLTAFVPLGIWSFIWILSGLFALVSVIPCWPGGSVGAILMGTIWAIGYTVSWVGSINALDFYWLVRVPLDWWSHQPHLWTVLLPHPWIVSDGSPAARDYLSASLYWAVCLLLSCGYVLSRFATSRGAGVRADR